MVVINLKNKYILISFLSVLVIIASVLIYSQNINTDVGKMTVKEAMGIEIEFENLDVETEDIYDFSRLAIGDSHTAVVCEYVGSEKSNLKYYKFKNHEVLYGEAPDEYIMSPINYSLNIELNEGAKYILFLKRYDVIYNPFPIYEIEDAFYFKECINENDEFICSYIPNADDAKGDVYQSTLRFKNINSADSLCDYIRCVAKILGYDTWSEAYYPNIFRGADLEEVVNQSDYLLHIKVEELTEDDIYLKKSVYKCSIERVLKKKGAVYHEFKLTTIQGSLEKGKDYIVAVCSSEKINNGKNFMICADNGIIPVDDKALTEEFYKYYYNK